MIAFGAENKEITSYPFIESIQESGDWNRLEIIIQFGKVGEKVIASHLPKYVQDLLSQPSVVATVPDDNERYLITFDWYLFYIVGNESHYTGFRGDYKGKWLTIVEDSELLKIGDAFQYGYNKAECTKHYHLLTSGHVLDIITSSPPTIEKLPPTFHEASKN